MSWEISDHNNWKYNEIPYGAMTLESGTSTQNLTGGWRVQRPMWDTDKCVNCLQCWINCPDDSIRIEDKKVVGIDYDHCKGCGVCVTSCKFDALKLVNEKEACKLDQKEGE